MHRQKLPNLENMLSDDRSRKPVGALDYDVVTLTPGISQGGTSIGREGILISKVTYMYGWNLRR